MCRARPFPTSYSSLLSEKARRKVNADLADGGVTWKLCARDARRRALNDPAFIASRPRALKEMLTSLSAVATISTYSIQVVNDVVDSVAQPLLPLAREALTAPEREVGLLA
ncbi:hypothetical protein MRX96_016476 [Rhipicephalus microplus]